MKKCTNFAIIYFKYTLSSVDTLFTPVIEMCSRASLRYGTLKGKDLGTNMEYKFKVSF